MVELFKYSSQIEEKLLKNDQRNNVQKSQIQNLIVDSFILGYITGRQREPRVKFSEFQRSLKVVQQLRNLKEINALKYEQLIELYNNVFLYYYDIQDVQNVIQYLLLCQKQVENQYKYPIEQQNFNTQNKSQNQQPKQTKASSIQSQFQTQNQQEKLTIQNVNNFNNNKIQLSQQPKQQQINQNEFASINQIPLTFSNQSKQNHFKSQQNQIKSQQPFKQKEFQQQFQEKQQNQNYFLNSDTFIINEIKQIRESITRPNNQNQQQELRKSQNLARIQQQFPPVRNSQMKIQQNSEQQKKQEMDQNKELEQQSIILAQKLQQEFDQEDLDNIEQDFTSDCDICFVQLNQEEMKVLDCGHIFHLNCLNQTCLTQMKSRQFPIYCPNQYCKKTPIIYNDLAQILDKINLELYQQLTFQSYIDSHGDEYSWCPTPDCQFVFISEGNNHFQCPVCSKQYCLNCKAEFHNGQTCEQFMAYKDMNEEDQQFYQLVLGAKFKQCPKCKFWVEKNEGCNHMTCRCKFHFCYTCGLDYKEECKCKDNYNVLMLHRLRIMYV